MHRNLESVRIFHLLEILKHLRNDGKVEECDGRNCISVVLSFQEILEADCKDGERGREGDEPDHCDNQQIADG